MKNVQISKRTQCSRRTMSTLVSMTKAQVPAYLLTSDFYRNLGADSDDEFCIPHEYFKETADVTNSEQLAHLLHTIKFWGLSRLPQELIELFIFKPKSFLKEESESVCGVLLEFDAEFGLLTLYQSLLECADEKERICAALECGKEDMLEYISHFDKQVNAALIKAIAENGHARLLAIVLEKCAKISRKNPFKDVSLITVASRGHVDCLRFLFEKGCKKHKDICRVAAENGHLACLQLAVEYKCVLNNTTCNAAAMHGHMDCLKYTLEHGCSVNMDTACAAAEGGQLECLQFVLDQGVRLLKRTCHFAAMSGNVACLQLLRNRGAPAWDTESARLAASKGHLDCLQYLLDAGCTVDHTVTQQAAEAGHAECLELLLNRNCAAQSDCVDRAAAGEHRDCLRVLKKFNIPIDTHWGSAELLTWRSFGRGITYARALFEAGYSVPKCTLTFALNCGDVECVEFLCANNLCKLDVHTTALATKGQNRASMMKVLHKYNCPWGPHTCRNAAENCDLESLKLAHEYGASWDKNTTTAAIQPNGMECLMYALKEGCPLSADACDVAASRGLCNILQLVHERGCVLTLQTCMEAARNKYVNCLTYAITHGAPVDATVCEAAATYVRVGSDKKKETAQTAVQVLECAHKLGCPWDERTCAAAAAQLDDQGACLIYAHQHGCPWDASTPTAATRAGQEGNLRYALENGCVGDADTCVAAAERGNIQSLQLMHGYGCAWDERVSRAAASCCRVTLAYCVENGCPIDAATMARYNAFQAAL